MASRVFRGENPSFFAYQDGKLQPKAALSGSVSTTYDLESAIYYAKHGGEYEYGYIYIIDLGLCERHKVSVEVIDNQSDLANAQDTEVVLHPADGLELPEQVVLEIRRTPSLLVEYNFCGYYNEDAIT